MAEGDTVQNWPGPVSFSDDEPRRGFATIFLSVPNMVLQRTLGFVGPKKKPQNTIVERHFEKGVIHVKVSVTEKEKIKEYEYKKNAPEDIDEERCKISFKACYVIIELAKHKQQSWASHKRYLIERPEL